MKKKRKPLTEILIKKNGEQVYYMSISAELSPRSIYAISHTVNEEMDKEWEKIRVKKGDK